MDRLRHMISEGLERSSRASIKVSMTLLGYVPESPEQVLPTIVYLGLSC